MGVIQDTFNQYRDRAYEGQVSTIEIAKTFSLEVETAPVPFGRAVMYGTGARSCELPAAATAADIKGFSIRSMAQENNNAAPPAPEYAVGEIASILRDGRMFAKCVGGAAKDATVHVVINVAGGDALGELRGTADATNTVELTQCKWAEAYADQEIGEIIVDGILTS